MASGLHFVYAEFEVWRTDDREILSRRFCFRRRCWSPPRPWHASGAGTVANRTRSPNRNSRNESTPTSRVRNDAVKGVGALKATNDPAEIKSGAERARAANCRGARRREAGRHLHAGDPRQRFRELLAPHLKGEDGRDAQGDRQRRRAADCAVQSERAVPRGQAAAHRAGEAACSICRRFRSRSNTGSSTDTSSCAIRGQPDR